MGPPAPLPSWPPIPPTLMAPLPPPPAHAAFCVDEQLTYLGFAEALHHLLPDVIRECALEVLLQQLSHCLIRHQWVTGLQNQQDTLTHLNTELFVFAVAREMSDPIKQACKPPKATRGS